MKLVLKNFCSWESAEFFFPDKGNVLISAPSGAGKTSIIRGIVFALFGCGNKIIKYGKKSCSVILEYKDLHIYRSKGPGRLVVNHVFEDDEAQSIINNKFNNTMFHLDQDNKTSFALLNSTEKLKYLETLIFNMTDLNNLKFKIKDLIKVRELSLSNEKSKLEMLTSLINDVQLPDEIILPKYLNYSETLLEEKEQLYKSLNSKQYEIKQHNDKIRKIQEQLENKRTILKLKTEQITNLTKRKQRLISEIKNEPELNELNKQFDLINKQLFQVSINKQFNTVKNEYDEQNQLYETIIRSERNMLENKIKEIEAELDKLPFNNEEQGKQYISKYKNELTLIIKYNELVKEYNKIYVKDQDIYKIKHCLEQSTKELTRYSTLYKDIKSTYNCPKCNTYLKLSNEKLIFQEQHSEISSKDILKKIDEITLEINEKKHQLKELEQNKIKTQMIEKNMKDICVKRMFKDKDYNFIKTNLQQGEEYFKLFVCNKNLLTKYYIELENIVDRFKKIKNRVEDLKEKYDELKNKVKQINETEFELIEEIKTIQNKISINNQNKKIIMDIKHQLTKLNQETEKLGKEYEYLTTQLQNNNYITDIEQKTREQIENCIKDISLISKYKEYYNSLMILQKYKKNIEQTKKQIKLNEELLSAALIFKQKLSEAESLALSNTLKIINTNVQIYLNTFFEDEPLTASLEAFKEIKNNKKPQINIDIYYKGNQVKISNLSGGERDRVVLAFALTLSDLSLNPFILLDECISSLDQENANNVFEFIKTYCKDKLIILIAHQIITGIFDKVYKL